MSKKKEVYSTLEIAGICHVDRTTVFRWVKSGKLRAMKTAGGHNRVPKEELSRFLNENRIPLPEELQVEKIKVVVIDDEPAIVSSVGRTISLHRPDRFAIREFTDPLEGLISIGQDPPQILLLDLMMPNMDGFQVCMTVKERFGDATKIIVMTGYPSDENRKRIANCGADRFLVKPFEAKELIEVVDAASEQA